VGWLRFVAATDDLGEKRYARDHAVSITPDSIGVASRKRMLGVTLVMLNESTEQRDARGFLLKNLLPLGLLALVTYLSLFFAADQAGARVGFAVTSILTASVLLESVTGPLDVGYTVAIEGVFYVYVALSAVLVFINIAVERLYKERRYRAVTRLDTVARVVYPLICLATIAFYAARYGAYLGPFPATNSPLPHSRWMPHEIHDATVVARIC